MPDAIDQDDQYVPHPGGDIDRGPQVEDAREAGDGALISYIPIDFMRELARARTEKPT